MRIHLFLAILSLGAHSAWAASTGADPSYFTGDWKSASGVYQKAGILFNCDAVEMVFSGTTQQFNFVSGHRHCVSQQDPTNSFDEPFQPQQSAFADGKLSMNGSQIGTVENGTMNISFSFPDTDGVNQVYSMSMVREGQFITYHEELTKLGVSDPLISFVTIMKNTSKNTKESQ